MLLTMKGCQEDKLTKKRPNFAYPGWDEEVKL